MASHDDRVDSDRRARALQSMGSPEEFFRCYWPWLLRILASQANDFDLAEEAASETFMAALDNWDKLLEYERPDSWLYKVGTRKLRRLEARARAQGSLAEDRDGMEADLKHAASADEWVADHLDLVSALRMLPRRQTEVIVLRLLADCSVRETAQILGVTEGTVKTQLSRAIGKLRVLLDDPEVANLVRRDLS
jgi:RNA polymerase sigma factor (sigma-70 family)